MKLRRVQMDSFWQSIRWSISINRLRCSFPTTLDQWNSMSEEENLEAWALLRQFFARKDYILYQMDTASGEQNPDSWPAVALSATRCHPYSRTLESDNHFTMLVGGNCNIYGARDKHGHDVVIKIVSDTQSPSVEYRILQKFNQAEHRRDDANRVIHVIEFITFDKLVFAVMPRWDPAFTAPFTTVAELMDMAKACLETMSYLHLHRVAHQDFSRGNWGMNIYATPELLRTATGVRNPPAVEYAVYDFGHSLLYSPDTSLANVVTSRRLRYYHAPDPVGSYDPFKADVAMMGGLLYGHVMHAAKIVPEIESLLDHMIELDEVQRPTASEALDAFQKLYETLTIEQLTSRIDCKWTNAFWPKHMPDP